MSLRPSQWWDAPSVFDVELLGYLDGYHDIPRSVDDLRGLREFSGHYRRARKLGMYDRWFRKFAR